MTSSPLREMRLLTMASLMLAVSGQWVAAIGQAPPDTTAPYFRRGRLVEMHQRELTARVQVLRDSLSAALMRWAPDLLKRLEPTPGIALGYQLLPRIVADPAIPADLGKPQPLYYSWTWSDTLLSRELATTMSIDAALKRAAAANGARASLDSIVTAFKAMTDRKRAADADVGYNWLWQGGYARAPESFDHAMQLIRWLMRPGEENGRAISAALAADARKVDRRDFVRVAHDSTGWTASVTLVTDIDDTTFLADFKRAVEDTWRVDFHGQRYRVAIDYRLVSTRSLYCGDPKALCSPPARGTWLTEANHVSMFPKDAAVLTTGAGSTHFTAGRAIVLSPYDAQRRTLAHEFGHMLGFRDAYLRGASAAGMDGYTIVEMVVERSDLMADHKTGTVNEAHWLRFLDAYGFTAYLPPR